MRGVCCAQRIGDRLAVDPEMLIVELAEVIPPAALDRPGKALKGPRYPRA
jgi:hypothetical protein